jgi:HAD superfamily hydrolase (TIGR01459 family)
MTAPTPLASIDDITADYDAVLCDIWGVVHNGRRAYAAACDALRRFRARGGAVVLVSNVPKPRDPIPAQLARLGVGEDVYDAIVTSGDAIRAELRARAPGPMFKIGPAEFDAVLWEGLGLAEAPLEEAAFIAVSGLNDDAAETPEDYRPMLQEARSRDLELLCANPDIVVRVGERLVWCAGAIAREYAAIGGRVVMAGKPHAPIYALARTEVARLRAASVPDTRILAIGDGAPTDVLGANREGIDCLFIADGINDAALRADGGLDMAAVAKTLAQHEVHARYAMPALA